MPWKRKKEKTFSYLIFVRLRYLLSILWSVLGPVTGCCKHWQMRRKNKWKRDTLYLVGLKDRQEMDGFWSILATSSFTCFLLNGETIIAWKNFGVRERFYFIYNDLASLILEPDTLDLSVLIWSLFFAIEIVGGNQSFPSDLSDIVLFNIQTCKAYWLSSGLFLYWWR